MFFASDNSGPVPPAIMEALARANTGHAMAYGNDAWMNDLRIRLRDIFEAPEAAVYLVSTGSAANTLALATLTDPWQTVYCTPVAHIYVDECNGPEFFSGGARLTTVGQGDRMQAGDFAAALAAQPQGDVHGTQRGPLSITQLTEAGAAYSLEEIKALTSLAAAHDLPVHMDGARFANALMALGCTPAEMTWRAGVDVLSFGGTKNGCLGVEAVIFFDPKHAWEFELRRKRAGHLTSKHRYLSAQMLGYLADDLWLDLAARANARGARLAAGLGQCPAIDILHRVDANMLFFNATRATHRALHEGGATYSLFGSLDGAEEEVIEARLVCDWSLPEAEIDRFLALAAA